MKKHDWISLAMAVMMAFSFTWSGRDQSLERDDLIRLHVIANSDSPEDQALKLHVRDRLLLSFGETFEDTRTMNQARVLIRENLDEMEAMARTEIRRLGYDYPVKAQLGIFPFPTKAYGDVVYPAGSYEALRVVIGEGTGANWWCVMFPPLCFVDVSGGVARRPAEEKTEKAAAGSGQKSVRTTEKPDPSADNPDRSVQEGDSSTRKPDPSVGKENKPAQKKVIYTFRLAQWWKGIKAWVARIFS